VTELVDYSLAMWLSLRLAMPVTGMRLLSALGHSTTTRNNTGAPAIGPGGPLNIQLAKDYLLNRWNLRRSRVLVRSEILPNALFQLRSYFRGDLHSFIGVSM
jgi:hypothetical protein